jgi:hypothetical protein
MTGERRRGGAWRIKAMEKDDGKSIGTIAVLPTLIVEATDAGT